METQTPHWSKLAIPVGFALLCLVLTLVAFRAFGGTLPLEPAGYRFAVPLPHAANLVEGSDVQTAGVTIGRVAAVRRTGTFATATVELEPRYAPIREATRAIVRSKTLLGEAYLELAPGSNRAPFLPDGGRLAADRVQPTVQLDEFLRTFPAHTRRDMREMFAGLAGALDDRAESLNDALGSAAPLSANLADVLDTLDDQQPALQRVFAGSGDVLETLGTRTGAVQAAVDSGNAVLATTARRDRELAATVRAFAPFLTQLRRTARTITASSGDLQRAVSAVRPAARELGPALTQTVEVAPAFRRLFAELPPVLTAGDHGLPALARILRAAGPALADVYPSVRELIPVMELFAAYRQPALVSVFTNAGSLTNGRSVGPGGKIVARSSGAASVWNESIGGWTRKLPSNRTNPYPPPDGIDEVSRGLVGKAYDCRHVNNPAYVPPTGTGVPPCLVQGPWDYDGKRRYYPRLTMTPP